jgi:hypothetical protein
MISQKYIDLMNQELDGVNTPDQTRELEKFLQDQQEARTYYRELALALNVFEKVAMVDPPPGLSAAILEGAGTGRDSHQTATVPSDAGGLWAAMRHLFSQRPRQAHTLTFTAGLVCGLVLLAGSSWLDTRHGTELNGQVLGTASVQDRDLTVTAKGAWHDPAIEGHYSARQEGRTLHLRLKVAATGPALIQFSHGPQTSLQHFDTDNPAESRLSVSGAQVELNLTGMGSYDLEFHRNMENKSHIQMTVYSEGRLVHTEPLNEGK